MNLKTKPSSKFVCVLTSSSLEFDSILPHIQNPKKESLTGTNGNSLPFKVRQGIFQNCTIVLICSLSAGSSRIQTAALLALMKYHPELMLFVGVAGGKGEKVSLGTVVISDYISDHSYSEESNCGILFKLRGGPISSQLLGLAQTLTESDEWRKRIQEPDTEPQEQIERNVIIGKISAGNVLVTSSTGPIAKVLDSASSDALAVEMESAALYDVAHLFRIPFLTVRGISDLLTDKTNETDKYRQPWAAAHASAVAFELIELFLASEQNKSSNHSESGSTEENIKTLGSTTLGSENTSSPFTDLAELKSLAYLLLETGSPPSISLLFPEASPLAHAALKMATVCNRFVIYKDRLSDQATRTNVAELVTMPDSKHLIVGEPGSGKTHALWQVAVDLLNEGNVIPLFLPVAQLKAWENVVSLITALAPNLSVEKILKDERVCVFIDGWSEFGVGEHTREKRIALGALHSTRVIANGRFSDAGDSQFKPWSLELLSADEVIAVVNKAQESAQMLSSSVVDLLRLPLLLSIHVLSGAKATVTGDLLRQFHEYLVCNFPEEFTEALAKAVASSVLANDRAYGRLLQGLKRHATGRVVDPTRILQRLGTIVERNSQALPIHDLYWSWLAGQGLLINKLTMESIDLLSTRESFALAIQSGVCATEEHVHEAVGHDLILAATLDASRGLRRPDSLLSESLDNALNDIRLAVRSRGGLAALELARPEYLGRALNVFSELVQSKLYISDWLHRLQPSVLFSHRDILANWIGVQGSEFVLDAIAERGGPEWVPWLEQISLSGKIPAVDALSAALGCSPGIPSWGEPYLKELLSSKPWKLRAAASRRSNRPLARQIAANYEGLMELKSGSFMDLNRILVACGDDDVFQSLLTRFDSMTPRQQELLGFAVVERGQPWIKEFQKVAFTKPVGGQHHELAEMLALDINDETARAWIATGYDEAGWRVLIARHGEAIIPELIASLPASFANHHYIPALASMRFLHQAPESLVQELASRLESPMQPMAMEHVLNALATVNPAGIILIVRFLTEQLDTLPSYHLAQGLRLYEKWRKKFGVNLAVLLPTGEKQPIASLVAMHCALHRWDEHYTPEMLAWSPDLAMTIVLEDLQFDDDKAEAVLRQLKDLKNYNAALLDRMLAVPKLAALIPDVFASCFDNFPAAALHRCIESSAINQDTLLFRLGSTSNPLHHSVHVALMHRMIDGPVNLSNYRYIGNMLRGYTRFAVGNLLQSTIPTSSNNDNWIWLVREVEAARGELFINEVGQIRQ
ncbi:MAG: 5'-methylthioadenosine/S-adenosylhomocysteine nucleosidase [Candidatus Obscuribacterales bacterium]